jgi:hypothetical protein
VVVRGGFGACLTRVNCRESLVDHVAVKRVFDIGLFVRRPKHNLVVGFILRE